MTSVLAENRVPRIGHLTQIDPRLRIVAATVFAVTVVACRSLPVLLAALAVAMGLLLVSRLPVRQTLRRMAAMDGFIVFMLLILPFSVPGDPLFTLWGFTASRQGLDQAIRIALTANAVILALMALVGTMEPVTLGHALFRLRVPEALVHLMMFTIRYIDVLRGEYLRLRQAMKARAFRPRTDRHSYRSFGYLLGMMLVRSMERSERILAAMKCRGFTGRLPLIDDLRLTGADAAFAAGFTLLLAGLLTAEVLYGAH
ncbi:cobalt ECF transporter T component CbiQ [Tropicimonas sp.]|uniref:cobalt ECF transporter T component CbiQ n=1 Tax=Tropicimonas sp. TaxID=2067044 RepID=UPI003A851ED6